MKKPYIWGIKYPAYDNKTKPRFATLVFRTKKKAMQYYRYANGKAYGYKIVKLGEIE